MIQESTISLFHRISGIIAKYDTIADITGERFNIFNILRLDSNEVKLHSALIAELLNPNGKHGRGNLFLNHFLDSLEEACQTDDEAEIVDNFRKEDVNLVVEKGIGYKTTDDTEGGRIDIFITTRNRYAIVIENKIYAGDERGQLRRYYNYCNDNFNKKSIIIYLTLFGKQASEETTFNKGNNEKITPVYISYKTFIIDWLEICRKDTVNHPILRETITQYIYLLKQLTHQTTNENMKNEIAEIVADNSDFIKSAEEIWKNQNEIKLQIIKNLMDKLRGNAKENGLDFDTNKDPEKIGEEDTGFGFKLENKSYWIYFYFRGSCENLEVGIEWVSGQTKDKDLADKIKNHFIDFEYGTKLVLDDWIWGCNFDPWSKATWAEKLSIMPDAIINKAKEFLDKLETFKH